jgi:hypothetical protein
MVSQQHRFLVTSPLVSTPSPYRGTLIKKKTKFFSYTV